MPRGDPPGQLRVPVGLLQAVLQGRLLGEFKQSLDALGGDLSVRAVVPGRAHAQRQALLRQKPLPEKPVRAASAI